MILMQYQKNFRFVCKIDALKHFFQLFGNIGSGSIIYDKWRAYDVLYNENYVHHIVNHSINFVDGNWLTRNWCSHPKYREVVT